MRHSDPTENSPFLESLPVSSTGQTSHGKDGYTEASRYD